jgi:hypothetical protein
MSQYKKYHPLLTTPLELGRGPQINNAPSTPGDVSSGENKSHQYQGTFSSGILAVKIVVN